MAPKGTKNLHTQIRTLPAPLFGCSSNKIPSATRLWNPRSRKARDLGHPRVSLCQHFKDNSRYTRAGEVCHPPCSALLSGVRFKLVTAKFRLSPGSTVISVVGQF